jgi:hypothetical protein
MGAISFPTPAINRRHFENRALCTGYLDGQANCLASQKSTQRCDNRVVSTRIVDLSRCIEHIINPLQHREKRVEAVKTEDSMKPISGSQCMKSGSIKVSDL